MLNKMRARLLALGGVDVTPGVYERAEAHYDVMCRDARVVDLPVTTIDPMVDRECHTAVEALHRELGEGQPWYGWALLPDGIWQVHSWLEWDGRLIETALPGARRIYLGVPIVGYRDGQIHVKNPVTVTV